MSVSSGWGRFTWGQAYWNRDALLATGWGAKAWNDGEWGNLADETVSLTGISATSNVGAVGILANALVIIWFIQIYKYKSKNLSYLVTTTYLGLNTLFLVLNGLSNNGEPRIFFWISISLTVLISILISNKKD